MISAELEKIFQLLYSRARSQHYEFISLEHLLLVMIEKDDDVRSVLENCHADLKLLSQQLEESIAENTPKIPDHLLDTAETQPTLGFQRVIQRAMVGGEISRRPAGRAGGADGRNRQPCRIFPQAPVCNPLRNTALYRTRRGFLRTERFRRPQSGRRMQY